MPRKAISCPCPSCKKPRITRTPNVICWNCRWGRSGSRPSQKREHRCTNAHCGRKVSGPDRTCQKCWGDKLRAKGRSESQEFVTEHASDRETRNPSRSWWATTTDAEFCANFRTELPRLLAIGAQVPKSQRPIREL